jgi:RND family efflux transporter MFP subunit
MIEDSRMNARLNIAIVTGALLLAAAGCSSAKQESNVASQPRVEGSVYVLSDTLVQTSVEASGTVSALRQATLSTKLMGSVLEVLVREGDAVSAGQPFVRIDARDLSAKADQAAAALAEAEAVHRDALTQAGRMRALYADSAATRAQLDAAETGLARAEAGVRTANAAAAELVATTSYATVRAPFAGVVTKRFVDPGAFAAPGAPLVTVQDVQRVRLTANATPDVARGIRRGQRLAATVEGRPVTAVVEGVVPATAGKLSEIKALVDNPGGAMLPGSAAILFVPLSTRQALVVPRAAVIEQGDLTGVTVRTPEGDVTRWVRLGRIIGSGVEVNAGLRAGDRVVVPSVGATTLGARN